MAGTRKKLRIQLGTPSIKKLKEAKKLRKAVKKATKKAITGHGEYLVPDSSLKQVGGMPIGEAVGQALGNLWGVGPVGKHVGGFAHRITKYLTGHGSYSARNDALNDAFRASGKLDRKTTWTGELPEFKKSKDDADGDIVVYDEVIGPVYGSTLFSCTSYDINISDSNSFPWLSQTAAMYQQWEVLGMIYHFRSEQSMFGSAAGGTLGKICLSTVYDPTAPLLTSMVAAEDQDYSSSYNGSTSFVHIMECKRSDTFDPLKFFRYGYTASVDRTASTCGSLLVSTEGFPTSGKIGTLYVSYKVRLLKPTITHAPVDSSFHRSLWLGSNGATLPFQQYSAGFNVSYSNITPYGVTINFPTTGRFILRVVGSLSSGTWASSPTISNGSSKIVVVPQDQVSYGGFVYTVPTSVTLISAVLSVLTFSVSVFGLGQSIIYNWGVSSTAAAPYVPVAGYQFGLYREGPATAGSLAADVNLSGSLSTSAADSLVDGYLRCVTQTSTGNYPVSEAWPYPSDFPWPPPANLSDEELKALPGDPVVAARAMGASPQLVSRISRLQQFADAQSAPPSDTEDLGHLDLRSLPSDDQKPRTFAGRLVSRSVSHK